jgi:phenylacetate-CoA ligase
VATTLDKERAEQARWIPKPAWQQSDVFESLLLNEFVSADDHAKYADAAVHALVGYASLGVPYYQRLFKELGLKALDIDGQAKLSLLPVLTKADLQRSQQELRSQALPIGHAIAGAFSTSGTTGERVSVVHTHGSRLMSALSRQRELRWFRFDPRRVLAHIRCPTDLPRRRGDGLLTRGETCHLPEWPSFETIFYSGPFLAFSHDNDIEAQLGWLKRHQPDYLLANAAHLEHLALAGQGSADLPRPEAMVAVSQQLTADMRQRIEQIFSAPVFQNYGLNEVGIVASRCPEGGRYHVHAEHSLVEIVDEEGRACAAGKMGKLLVTALANPAMPLIRYDTDDLAIAADGLCPCGRTLPGFAEVIGRYRRTALLPPGTWEYWDALLRAVGREAPKELIQPLRQYQLHQNLDNTFELRLAVAGGSAPELLAFIHAAWLRHGGREAWPLRIRLVDEIPRPKGRKFQSFTSDFAPFPNQTDPGTEKSADAQA